MLSFTVWHFFCILKSTQLAPDKNNNNNKFLKFAYFEFNRTELDRSPGQRYQRVSSALSFACGGGFCETRHMDNEHYCYGWFSCCVIAAILVKVNNRSIIWLGLFLHQYVVICVSGDWLKPSIQWSVNNKLY